MKTKILRLMAIPLISFTLLNCTRFSSSTEETCNDTSNLSSICQNENLTQPEVQYLSKLGSCSALLSKLQENAIKDKENDFDQILECQYYGIEEVATTSDTSSSTNSSSSGIDYTTTNTQEENVDEADTIKTNGEYIYIANEEFLEIYKAWPKEDFAKVNVIEFDDDDLELYLQDNQLIVISKGTYSYSTKSYSSSINVYNLNDPENPNLEFSKSYNQKIYDSRLVNNRLHLIFKESLYYSSGVSVDYEWEDYDNYCENGDSAAKAKLETAIANAKEEVRNVISATSLEDWNIGMIDTSNEEECSLVYADGSDSSTSLTALNSLDLETEDDKMSVIFGRANDVYASTNSFYITSYNSTEEATEVHKFSITDPNELNDYTGSGSVKGDIVNSFAMSEHENTFRIATTTGSLSRWNEDNTAKNHLYILDISQNEMEVIGSVEDLAENESIYSARFIGDKAYIVTYQKVDPLFVIDLADPENPYVAGELKMPGYSTYIHPISENLLLGLGKDAEEAEEGDFSWFQGLKLASFDVTNSTDPQLADELIIGDRGSYSEALYNHHGFNFDTETNTLFLPVTLYEGETSGSEYGEYSYDGIHIYSVTENGIEMIKEISLNTEYNNVERSIKISNEDTSILYVLNQDSLIQIDMNQDYSIDAQIELE